MIDEPLALLAEAFGQDPEPLAVPADADRVDPLAIALDAILLKPPVAPATLAAGPAQAL